MDSPKDWHRPPLSPNDDSEKGPYTISYEAKSTSKANGHVSNKEVGAGRLARHRRNHEADYTLVVAPDFEIGALQQECEESCVTPMRAKDLARLLILSATAGTVDFVKFRSLFELHHPDEVQSWVEKFVVDAESQTPFVCGGLTLGT